jgi:hypothetical protein
MELRWSDENGRHFEQGDLSLWIVPPDRTALDITKFGERIMWLGSNGPEAWLFDFRGDETVLHVAAPGDGPVVEGSGDLPIEPGSLFALCGLTRLAPSVTAVVAWDAGLDAYVVGPPPGGRGTRLFLDRQALLPVRAETLDAEGRVLLYSELNLRRYEPVRMAGAPLRSGPRFPTLVDIYSTDDRVGVKLSVYSPVDDAEEVRPRYFDLEWLVEKFRPGRIEGDRPMAAAP